MPSYAGLHLSGANANKTSLAVLRGDLRQSPIRIMKVYEKIGSFGTLFSDERLVEILAHSGPFAQVFVDCPLTVPPCVACQRPTCPGAVQCDDVSVAYMLKVSGALRRRGAAKARPVNPQSQRLWDVIQLDQARGERGEPSYSANLAPLVARARTLQRRLVSVAPELQLKETSVAQALELMGELLGLGAGLRLTYRKFEGGLEVREEILQRLVATGWLVAEVADEEIGEHDDPPALSQVAQSVETFHAFVAAWVAALHHAGLTRNEPANYVAGEGWVYLPEPEACGEGRRRQPV